MRDHAFDPTFRNWFGITRVNRWSCVSASQETMKVLLILLSLLGQCFYNRAVTYLIKKKIKKLKELESTSHY